MNALCLLFTSFVSCACTSCCLSPLVSALHGSAIARCMQRIGLARCMWEAAIGRPRIFAWSTLPTHILSMPCRLAYRHVPKPRPSTVGLRCIRAIRRQSPCVVLLCASQPGCSLPPDIPVARQACPSSSFLPIVFPSPTTAAGNRFAARKTPSPTRSLTRHSRHRGQSTHSQRHTGRVMRNHPGSRY